MWLRAKSGELVNLDQYARLRVWPFVVEGNKEVWQVQAQALGHNEVTVLFESATFDAAREWLDELGKTLTRIILIPAIQQEQSAVIDPRLLKGLRA